eukprot:Plantae.Rhodophyta-Purpureofilum_apyrenoidigerum.ctg10765.p1 GENE.Plantae.Rhodophyta-Purpureofilum_apyrenoidigerum.ctg10765~~Plantae.Rhodophyta-Purpureofilum_apyrenoidigerum.ctg10765.p1  ORF type:complete len:336 (+),score=41.70 Plantae.Rhodophyta-Purpureofilum_apyrenoidigerum.ctg10765:64-1071(+)
MIRSLVGSMACLRLGRPAMPVFMQRRWSAFQMRTPEGDQSISGGPVQVEDGYRPDVSSLSAEHMFPLWTAGTEWTKNSVRSGILGVKCGGISLWDAKGKMMGLTVVCIDRCQVTKIQRPRKESKTGHWTIEVSGGIKRPYRLKKPQRYAFAAAGVEPKAKSVGFGVTEDAILPPGTELTALHFQPGQHVDVKGISKDKGFSGAVKRWGFAGQPSSRGVTKAHRKIGSTGTRMIKTKKGRKMPGQLGGRSSCTLNVKVYKVDGINNLIYLLGAVPGRRGSWVMIRDAHLKRSVEGANLPFPTKFLTGNEEDKELIKTSDGVNLHIKEATLYPRPLN